MFSYIYYERQEKWINITKPTIKATLMRFTSYLIETHKHARTLMEKHELVLQKVIDAVDNGHVEYGDSKISFDIGDISDTPQLSGLKLVIRPAASDEIKLGRDKDGRYAIVINTTSDMPGRMDIDTFLASKPIYAGFQKAYETYVKNYHDHSKEVTPNATQQKVAANSRENFEGAYTGLMHAIGEHTKKYHDSIKQIDAEIDKIANIGRKKTLELAKDNLRDEFLGKDAKEFVAKVMKLPAAEFTKHLDKTWKEKLESRLSNYFTSTYGK